MTVCAGFLLVFSLWVLYELISGYSAQRVNRQKFASHMTKIVVESINCELRNNDDYIHTLPSLFNRLIKSNPIKHIMLDFNDHALVGINNDKKYYVDFDADGYHIMKDVILIRRNIVICQDGKTLNAILIVAFDTGECFANTNSRGNLLSIFFVMGCVCASLLFLAWSYSIRNKELMSRLKSAKDKRKHVDELGLAAAGLAHETKNPLGVIRGLAQNISDNRENNKKTRRMARDIMEETDITTARLGDFLSYAKFRSPKPEEIKTKEYIERIVGLLKDDFDNAGVELITSIETETISADQDMLSQILMNLLTNSLRFTEKSGSVTLSIREKLNKTIELKVEDTGAGIPPEILPNILKPYVTSSSKGYGIGLAIVKRIVDQSGWNIKVDSTLKSGTTITISNIKRGNRH